MIITIGGKCGAGKGTLAAKLGKYLNYQIIGIGEIKRKLSADQGMTILERDQLGRSNPEKAREHDLQFEEYQKSLDSNASIILDSRLGFYCQPHAFKIFLDVRDEIGAERIFHAKRLYDANESYQQVLDTNNKRNYGQQQAYQKLYNIDIFDMSHYDLVIDTSEKTEDEVFDLCLTAYQNFCKKL